MASSPQTHQCGASCPCSAGVQGQHGRPQHAQHSAPCRRGRAHPQRPSGAPGPRRRGGSCAGSCRAQCATGSGWGPCKVGRGARGAGPGEEGLRQCAPWFSSGGNGKRGAAKDGSKGVQLSVQPSCRSSGCRALPGCAAAAQTPTPAAALGPAAADQLPCHAPAPARIPVQLPWCAAQHQPWPIAASRGPVRLQLLSSMCNACLLLLAALSVMAHHAARRLPYARPHQLPCAALASDCSCRCP